jgi:hypothetical protein
MKPTGRWLTALLCLTASAAAGCATVAEEDPAQAFPEPAVVERLAGSGLNRVAVTPRAADRLGISAVPVRPAPGAREIAAQTVIPYAAVLYGPNGATWVYTESAPLQYTRHRVTVEHIAAGRALLSSGPPVGTLVVNVGAMELFGAEFGVDH